VVGFCGPRCSSALYCAAAPRLIGCFCVLSFAPQAKTHHLPLATRTPQCAHNARTLQVFNKTDIVRHDFALTWMDDFDAYSAALEADSSYASTLSRWGLGEREGGVSCWGRGRRQHVSLQIASCIIFHPQPSTTHSYPLATAHPTHPPPHPPTHSSCHPPTHPPTPPTHPPHRQIPQPGAVRVLRRHQARRGVCADGGRDGRDVRGGGVEFMALGWGSGGGCLSNQLSNLPCSIPAPLQTCPHAHVHAQTHAHPLPTTQTQTKATRHPIPKPPPNTTLPGGGGVRR